MGRPFNVSENIGFDGYSYYCRRCGKAGYSKPTQVRGHLGMCPGTLARKGVLPTTSCNQLPTKHSAPLQNREANQLQLVREAPDAGFTGSQLLQQPVVVGPVGSSYQDQQLAGLSERVSAMENHYNHILQERNMPQTTQDWFNKNKSIIIIAGIILVAVWMMNQSRPACSTSETSSVKKSTFGNVGEKAVYRLIDKGISKSVDRLFS